MENALNYNHYFIILSCKVIAYLRSFDVTFLNEILKNLFCTVDLLNLDFTIICTHKENQKNVQPNTPELKAHL